MLPPQEAMEVIMTNLNIRPELTAISIKHSKSAEMLAEMAQNTDGFVLDYGCGTGRNMDYLLSQGIVSCGCDIQEQLDAQADKHLALMEKGCLILPAENFGDNQFDFILCSHVLNVIHDDVVKIAVLSDIARLLKTGGLAYIEVRTKHDVEAAKTKEAFGNGYVIKKGSAYTYQEAISKAGLEWLCRQAHLKVVAHTCNSSKHIIVVQK